MVDFLIAAPVGPAALVLQLLDPIDLCSAQCVSKPWYSLLQQESDSMWQQFCSNEWATLHQLPSQPLKIPRVTCLENTLACKKLSVGMLKTVLKSRGVSFQKFFEKSEFVRAVSTSTPQYTSKPFLRCQILQNEREREKY